MGILKQVSPKLSIFLCVSYSKAVIIAFLVVAFDAFKFTLNGYLLKHDVLLKHLTKKMIKHKKV